MNSKRTGKTDICAGQEEDNNRYLKRKKEENKRNRVRGKGRSEDAERPERE